MLPASGPGDGTARRPGGQEVGGNTVEVVLLEISNSMKPYPSASRTYTSHA